MRIVNSVPALRQRHLTWPILVLLLIGCYSPSDYAGDGVITETYDHGRIYKISLGSVDLTSQSTSIFELAGLPSEEFDVGFNLRPHSGSFARKDDVLPINAVVRVRLVNERDEVVIDESQSLERWDRGGPDSEPERIFLFLRGNTVDVPNDSGSVRRQLVVKADEGWGTSFEARRDGRYRLELTIMETDANAKDIRIELAVYGGWRMIL